MEMMKGLAFLGNEKVVLKEYPKPVPKRGEVLIKVKASCICRSDMRLYHADKPSPFVPGHEPAGIVEAIGEGVTMVKPGDRVAVYLAVGCNNCDLCKQGYFFECKDWKCIGFDMDGGNAEYMVMPQQNCLKIPDEMSYVEAAVSTDAFGGLYAAETKMGVSGKDVLALFGIGPMGGAGVLAGKALGAFVIACDTVEERLKTAKKLGADVCINVAKTNVVEKIKELTNGKGADVTLDLSGAPGGQVAALESVKTFGRMGFLGENHETTIDPRDHIIAKQLRVYGNWYFPLSMYNDILQIIRLKKVPLEKLVSHRFKLEDAETAFRMFDNKETDKVVFEID